MWLPQYLNLKLISLHAPSSIFNLTRVCIWYFIMCLLLSLYVSFLLLLSVSLFHCLSLLFIFFFFLQRIAIPSTHYSHLSCTLSTKQILDFFFKVCISKGEEEEGCHDPSNSSNMCCKETCSWVSPRSWTSVSNTARRRWHLSPSHPGLRRRRRWCRSQYCIWGCCTYVSREDQRGLWKK